MKRFYVYALLDPRRSGRMEMWPCSFFEEPFYVGKGTQRRARLHGCKSSRSPAKDRILEIEADGQRTSVMILADGLLEDESFAIEKFFIAQIGRRMRNEGPLLNRTAGGQGSSGLPMPQATRDAVSRAQKGKKRPPEFGAAVSAGKKGKPQTKLKGRKRDPSVTRRIADAQRGKPRPNMVGHPVSIETRAKISATRKGKALSAEAIAKIVATKAAGLSPEEKLLREFRRVGVRFRSLRRLARQLRSPPPSPEDRAARAAASRFKPGHKPAPLTPEGRAKRSAASKARGGPVITPEVRAKMSAARLGKKRPPEVGAKISATKKGRPNLRARGVPRPPHVIQAMIDGRAKSRAEKANQ